LPPHPVPVASAEPLLISAARSLQLAIVLVYPYSQAIIGRSSAMDGHQEKVQFIWSVAELLRGPYQPWEYGGVILPFTVVRRLDCALTATKDAMLAKAAELRDDLDPVVRDRILASAARGGSTTSTASHFHGSSPTQTASCAT
jgi:hypothetical protein